MNVGKSCVTESKLELDFQVGTSDEDGNYLIVNHHDKPVYAHMTMGIDAKVPGPYTKQ